MAKKRKKAIKIAPPTKLECNKRALAWTFSVLFMLDVAIVSIFGAFGKYQGAVALYESFLVLYSTSFVGSVLGIVEMGVYGLIAGYLAAWLYNKFSNCGC